MDSFEEIDQVNKDIAENSDNGFDDNEGNDYEDFNSHNDVNGINNQLRSSPQLDPDTMLQWRQEFQERLQLRDEQEEDRKEKLKEEALKEMTDWQNNYEEQQDKRREINRDQQTTLIIQRDAREEGGEWERICRLCDFNPKTASKPGSRDTTRLRGILLQLKVQPLVR